MRTFLKIVIALFCVLDAFFAGVSGLVMLISPDTARQEFGESDASVVAGVLAILMCLLFLSATFSVFRNPQSAVIALAITIAIQIGYVVMLEVGGIQLIGFTLVVFGLALLSWLVNRQEAEIMLSATTATMVASTTDKIHSHEWKFCTQCGEQTAPGSRYCGNCGTALD